jgi:hypothetical protein
MENTNKQPQTIGEWLDWAEEQGYEWAKEAMVEVVMQHGAYGFTEVRSDLPKAILGGFSWSKSDKGFEYWNQIHESLSI